MASKFTEAMPIQAVQDTGFLQKIGETTRIVGSKVEAFNQDGGLRELAVGDPIYLHDVITTANDTFVTITLIDHTVFQLGPSSKATLNIYQYDKQAGAGAFDADLVGGLFRFISGGIAENKEGQHSVLHTPVAKIGVRGSELDISVSAQGDTTILHSLGFIDVVTRNQTPFSVFHPQTRIYIAASDAVTVEATLLSPQQFGSLRAWTDPLALHQVWASLPVLPINNNPDLLKTNNDYDWQDIQPNNLPIYLSAMPHEHTSVSLNKSDSLRSIGQVTVTDVSLSSSAVTETKEDTPSETLSNSIDTTFLNHRPEIHLPSVAAATLQMLEDQALYLPQTHFLRFASDADHDVLSLSQVSLLGVDGADPLVSLDQNAAGDVVLTPQANASGLAYLQYQVRDSQGWQSEIVSVPIVIKPQNDPPVVHGSIQLTVSADHTLSLSRQQILSHVTDTENHPLAVIAFQDADYNSYQQGLVNDAAGNQWQILSQEDEIIGLMLTPNVAATGHLFLNALVIDLPEDKTLPAPVLVPIEIDITPALSDLSPLLAQDDQYQLHTLSASFSLAELLSNDQYNLHDITQFKIMDVSAGTATYDAVNQTVIFNSDTPLSNSRIDYQIQDKYGQSSQASIHIEWRNQAPSATDDVLYLPSDSDSLIPLSRLLANDVDPEQDAIQLSQLSLSTNGEISVYDAQHLLFQPNSAFATEGGAFEYQIQDHFAANSPLAHVDIQVLSGGFLQFSQPLQWAVGQSQVAVIQDAQINRAYLNAGDKPVLALQLTDSSAGSLGLQTSANLLRQDQTVLYEQNPIAQIVENANTGTLLLQFDANTSDKALQALLDAVYFSPIAEQNPQSLAIDIQLHADAASWIAQDTALDSTSRVLPLPSPYMLHDDVINLAFASSELLSTQALLANDRGSHLSVVDLSDFSPGVYVNLQDQQLKIFVDEAQLQQDQAEFSYTATDAQGINKTARVQLNPINVQNGDANENLLIGSEHTDILRGEANDDILQGMGGDDIIYGGAGADLLNGGGDNDSIFAGLGDDVIQLSSDRSSAYIDGGEGEDSLQLQGENLSLNLVINRLHLPEAQLQLHNIERIDLASGDNQLLLKPEDVFDINESHRLFIDGLEGEVISRGDWQDEGSLQIDGQTYQHYHWQNSSDTLGDVADLYVHNQLSQFIF